MKIVPDHVYARGTRDICYEPFESFGFLWFDGFLCWNIPPTKSQQQGMSSVEASELVAASASQKKDLDKLKGQNRRNWSSKRGKKASTNKIKKIHDIIFSDISRFATQTFDGGWYCGVVTKIEFKTKVHNYKHNRWLQRRSNKPELTQVRNQK